MMVPTSRRESPPIPGANPRPYAFLVSTTGCAKGISKSLGSAAYSYYFVLEALAPVLEQLGTWRLIERPESSLPYAAARAEAEGYQPVHLALHPPQDVYLTPALPNVIFPFWEFPDIPDRDFGHDTRQNWVRISNRADLIITACEFTAKAFRRSGVTTPVSVVPVPLKPEHFAIPAWNSEHTWTPTLRHVVWGGPKTPTLAIQTVEAPVSPDPISTPRPGFKRRTLRALKKAYRKVRPWRETKMQQRFARTRHYLMVSAGVDPHTMKPISGRPGPARMLYAMSRDGYRNYVRRWLSHEAVDRINRTKIKALKMIGREPVMAPEPLLPSTPVTIGGLVYTSIFNLGDRRKNHTDLLSAFLIAFQDREDVTLVVKLATNPAHEHHEVNVLRNMYQSLGIEHKCRLVVITDFLTDAQMAELMRVTTFYVNTSKAEGACLPLQQSLAAGRPSIAPDHTSMADFMDDRVGFVLRSFPEPTYWPHDPTLKTETTWNRLVWSDLRDHLIESASMAESTPEDYQAMAEVAQARMAGYASREIVTDALRDALSQLPKVETGRFAWAS